MMLMFGIMFYTDEAFMEQYYGPDCLLPENLASPADVFAAYENLLRLERGRLGTDWRSFQKGLYDVCHCSFEDVAVVHRSLPALAGHDMLQYVSILPHIRKTVLAERYQDGRPHILPNCYSSLLVYFPYRELRALERLEQMAVKNAA
uniref:hypothetical protein n=1 Tax=Ochrobactrum sp. LM19 TaxID=1449781 RepID=UPI0015E7EFCF|nr:hypothetical protein [Ochrobactrum sp. LM19]